MLKEGSMGRRKFLAVIGGTIVVLATVGSILGYMAFRRPQAQTGKKILLIFSYHPEYPWVVEENKGIEDTLKDKKLVIEKFYMDTKRRTSPEWMEKVAEDAVKKITEFSPDLVIVLDDNACELVAKKYAGKNLPFVFCGMNGNPEDYGFPADNVTGVIERHHIKENIELLKRLVPTVEKAAIITDNNPTSTAFINRVKETALSVEILEFATNDFNAWKAKVRELQPQVDAIGLFTYHTIKESGREESLPPEEVLEWTLENSKLPEFAFFDFSLKGGALCGVTLSGYEQGKTAAEIAIKILEGTKPGDIPIESPEKGNLMVNKNRAEELDIEISEDILKDAEIAYE
ncbi:MAG: hypothetical protein NWE90_08100 [Candidatus Bathyarchaeota archaeon]|nr:hypothetical protein [Candidatus Bathyarchaeota archaeon]